MPEANVLGKAKAAVMVLAKPVLLLWRGVVSVWRFSGHWDRFTGQAKVFTTIVVGTGFITIFAAYLMIDAFGVLGSILLVLGVVFLGIGLRTWLATREGASPPLPESTLRPAGKVASSPDMNQWIRREAARGKAKSLSDRCRELSQEIYEFAEHDPNLVGGTFYQGREAAKYTTKFEARVTAIALELAKAGYGEDQLKPLIRKPFNLSQVNDAALTLGVIAELLHRDEEQRVYDAGKAGGLPGWRSELVYVKETAEFPGMFGLDLRAFPPDGKPLRGKVTYEMSRDGEPVSTFVPRFLERSRVEPKPHYDHWIVNPLKPETRLQDGEYAVRIRGPHQLGTADLDEPALFAIRNGEYVEVPQ